MIINILDSVMCQASDPDAIKPALMVKREFWKPDPITGRKVRKEYEASLVSPKGLFLTGFLPRVLDFCEDNLIEYCLEGTLPRLHAQKEMHPPGITLFDDQIDLLKILIRKQRGIVESPMGTGKTILCYAVISAFKPKKALVLCGTKSIMIQTAKTFAEEFNMKISMVGDGEMDLSGDIVVAIVNSLRNIPSEDYEKIFDLVIVDEAHHVSSFEGMYFDVLTNIKAPVKIGVTAKMPKEGTDKAMAAEGLLGPIIGTFSIHEATEAGRLIKPKLVLLEIPKNANLRELRTYQEIYEYGIVYNRMRNNIIANFITKQAKEGNTSIVFTKLLEHANFLCEMLRVKGVRCYIVNGSVSGALREDLRARLNNKEIDCIVATAAWKEGINIPSLNIVINAAGYQSNIPVIQMAGRCLRVDEGKEEAMVVDCLDVGKYLSVHCVERLQTYSKMGWL